MIKNQTQFIQGIETLPSNVDWISFLDEPEEDVETVTFRGTCNDDLNRERIATACVEETESKVELLNSLTNFGVAAQNKYLEDTKKVKTLVQAIYDIMKIYGYREGGKNLSGPLYREFKIKTNKDKSRLEEKYLEFVKRAGVGSWKDLFKYKINAFFSYVMKQKVPPPPKYIEEFPELLNPATISYGRGKRFIRNMSRNVLVSFAQSIAQCKKGAPPVSKEMVLEAEIKTFNHLTTRRDDIPDFILKDEVFNYPINRDTICYQLRRTVREIFRKKVPTWDELTKPFVPSTSSQYNFSRNGMGAVGAFLENENIQKSYEKKVTFIGFSLGPVNLKKELTELYGKAGVEDQERIDRDFENIMVKGSIGLHFNGEELCELWKNVIYPKMLDEALVEQPHTIVIGLPEPLKVRCITAGPPLTYSVLKPMQKWLWRNLKEESCFQLIGTPVTCEIVKNQLGQLKSGEVFISGDYKASTDNLHSWVSECLLEALIEVFLDTYTDNPDKRDQFYDRIQDFRILMKRALTGHKLMNPIYNDAYRKGTLQGNEPDLFRDQQEGQLMGSIISFIFLCLANGALCRYAMEISDGDSLRITDREIDGSSLARLLINGDDCVFIGKIGLIFDIWESITAFGGLESSVGKTFESREFMTINSCQYAYGEDLRPWEDLGTSEPNLYEEIKYVNLGLVYGQKKDGVRGKPFYRLGAICRDLHRTCPAEYYDLAFGLFLKNARKRRYKEHSKDGKFTQVEDFFGCIQNADVPYFLPEWLGGLGLIPSKKVANNAYRKWDMIRAGLVRELIGSGIVDIRSLTDKSEWGFHSLVKNRLADYRFLEGQTFLEVEYDGTTRTLEDEDSKLYQLMVVDRLLNEKPQVLKTNINLHDEERRLRKAAISNAKIWKSVSSRLGWEKGFVNRLVESELASEKKNFHLACFDIRSPKILAPVPSGQI